MKKLTLSFAKQVFLAALKAKNLSAHTITNQMQGINKFARFLKSAKGAEPDLREVGLAELSAYLKSLEVTLVPSTKQPLSARYKEKCIHTAKKFFRCLYVHDYLLTNPLQDFTYKRNRAGSTRAILSSAEMGRVLDGIDLKAQSGLRDRALYELMYGAGLRREEVLKLRVLDIDFERHMLFVQGKGGKARLQPVSESGLLFLKSYLAGRKANPAAPVFPGSAKGGTLSLCTVNLNFKKWVKKAGIKRKGVSTHSIRHSVATQLLENGANIRYVQAFLGHESIKTTTIYTHVLYQSLRRIYQSVHPRENAYYQEIDEPYQEQLAAFKRQLCGRKRELERLYACRQARRTGLKRQDKH